MLYMLEEHQFVYKIATRINPEGAYTRSNSESYNDKSIIKKAALVRIISFNYVF